MINKEELALKIKLISQDAWQVGTNTSLNGMLEYIVRETGNIFVDQLVYQELLISDLADEIEELKNGSKDGGISEPKRITKASIKRNTTTEARQSPS